MRIILALVVLLTGLSTLAEAAAPSTNPARTGPAATLLVRPASIAARNSLDLRFKDLPTEVPPRARKLVVPNLNPLIKQLMRHSELDTQSTKIMPWVYASGTEMMVADYEDAVTKLESAGLHLQAAMHNLVERKMIR